MRCEVVLVAWLWVVCTLPTVQGLPPRRGGGTAMAAIRQALFDRASETLAWVEPARDAGQVALLEEGTTESATDKPIRVYRGGKMKLKCQCLDEIKLPTDHKLVMERPFGVCGVNEVKVVTRETGSGMSEDDVRMVVGNPYLVKWATIKYHHFSDWEPRTSSLLLGTPGGDLIEWINMLDVYEDMTGARFRWWHCRGLMYRYLRVTKKMSFYMATDSPAVNQLGGYVGMDNIDLRVRPQGHWYWRILRALQLPEHNGCRLLKDMLANPDFYEIRRGLPECAIQGFYHVLWNKWRLEGKKLRVVELDNGAKAKAVWHVKTSKSCIELGLAPLLQARTDDFAMYVSHQDAVNAYREELTNFITDLNERVDPVKFLENMKTNGEKYLGMALNQVANGLPQYEVSII